MAALTIDARHQIAEPSAIRDPARRAAFVEPAEVEKLDIQSANRSGFAEHLALEFASRVPCRLPTHGGVECENEAAALASLIRRRERAGALDERVDLGTRRSRGRLATCVGGSGRRLVGRLVAFACHFQALAESSSAPAYKVASCTPG